MFNYTSTLSGPCPQKEVIDSLASGCVVMVLPTSAASLPRAPRPDGHTGTWSSTQSEELTSKTLAKLQKTLPVNKPIQPPLLSVHQQLFSTRKNTSATGPVHLSPGTWHRSRVPGRSAESSGPDRRKFPGKPLRSDT